MKCRSVTFLKTLIRLRDLNGFPETKEDKLADSNNIVPVSRTAAVASLRLALQLGAAAACAD